MTDKQENKLRMYYTVSAVCESNVDIWGDNESFKQAYDAFRVKLPLIEKLQDVLEIENAGLDACSNNITRLRFSRGRIKAASDNLRKHFKETDELLINKMDKEIQDFKEDAPDFYYQYNAARIMLYPVNIKDSKSRLKVPMMEN